MREVVQLNFGQWGNQIGSTFWKMIGEEHSVDLDGSYIGEQDQELLNINIYYNQITDNKYVPRWVFTDLDPRSNDAILSGEMGHLYSLDSFVSGASGTDNNWAKGHYTDYYDILYFLMDRVRKEIESWDWFQGFQFIHSLSGGTGSGLGARVISELRWEYPDRIFESSTVFPSTNIQYCLTEPYNACLSLHQLVENCDFVNVIQNESLYNINTRSLHSPNSSFIDMNYLIGLQMSDLTSSIRFESAQASNIRKILVNLCPFPRLHFYACSFSPLSNLSNSSNELKINSLRNHDRIPASSSVDMVQNMFDDK